MNKTKKKTGRTPKLNPKTHCIMVRFDDEEYNQFLALYGKSGVRAKAVFLKTHFFGQPFKVVNVDKSLVDYCTKLSDFHAQFRNIGTNYNQVVKELRVHLTLSNVGYTRQIKRACLPSFARHFSERKTIALLYKLERYTIQLADVSHEIVELSRKLEER